MNEKTIITFEGVKYHLVGAGLPKRGEMYLDMVEQKVLKADFNHAINSQIIVEPVKWKPVIDKDVYVIYVGSGRIIKKMFLIFVISYPRFHLLKLSQTETL